MKVVEEIVELISKDPVISVATPVTDFLNKVNSNKSMNNEDLNCFVSRFSGFGAEHLMKVGSTSQSQIGAFMAKNFLNNASCSLKHPLPIPSSDLFEWRGNKIKGMMCDDIKLTLNLEEAQRIYLDTSKLTISISRASTSSNRTEKLLTRNFTGHFNDVQRHISRCQAQLRQYRKDKRYSRCSSSGRRCILSLDEMVDELCSLAQTTSINKFSVSRSHFDIASDHNVRSSLESHETSQKEEKNRKESRNRILSGKIRINHYCDGPKRRLDRDIDSNM